ncbi:SRPBCC family protein [Mucilaginibacter antarcticus]|uniref:SRPBCC family protein n=1 Tax=Mucilaginibacter antarcticus TaxID=1855725 RepID=A0ABW5XP92_9SPHI
MTSINLNTSITINAPAEKVWKAIVDPAVVEKYFFGTQQLSDFKKGSEIVWTGVWDGKTYRDHGNILDIVPGSYLQYSYWSSMGGLPDIPENYQTVTYNLSEADGVTTMLISQDNVKSEAAKEHSEANWQYIFGQMTDMIERGQVD